jgi:hypothetical protein
VENGTATYASTAVYSGVVTGVRLLVVMISSKISIADYSLISVLVFAQDGFGDIFASPSSIVSWQDGF